MPDALRRCGDGLAPVLMKGCLHTHTTCSDGKLSPQQVADAYEEKGYDFIAFTDHDYLLKPKSSGVYRGVRSGLILFEGIELTVFVKGYVHVNRIYGEEDELYVLNHLGEYDLSMEQVLDRVETVAGMFPLDAVEITSKGFRNPEYEIPEIRFPKIASDDAHTRLGIGRAWIELDGPRDKDSIIRKIRQGDFWNCYV